MAEQPSDCLIQQRIRNRIMEAVLTFAKGEEGVRQVWPDEYFQSFFDWVPYRSKKMSSYTALTKEEKAKLLELSSLVDQACDATPKLMTAEELIATGWPSRIQPLARETLNLFLGRGRFDEEKEEESPSSSVQWS